MSDSTPPFSETKSKESSSKRWLGLSVGVAISIGASIGWGLWMEGSPFNETSSHVSLDAWGSSFGLLSTIFTGLAMTGGLMAYFAQKETLDEQRRAYKEQTELNESQIAFIKTQSEFISKQDKALADEAYDRKKQSFENAFFQLVDRITRVFTESRPKEQSDSKHPKNCPASKQSIEPVVSSDKPKSSSPHSPLFTDGFLSGRETSLGLEPEIVTNLEKTLQDFVRTLSAAKLRQMLHLTQALLELLESPGFLKPEDKQLYQALLRAHLSEEQLLIMSFGALTTNHLKLKLKIESSNLLVNLTDTRATTIQESLGNRSFREILEQIYNPIAFNLSSNPLSPT